MDEQNMYRCIQYCHKQNTLITELFSNYISSNLLRLATASVRATPNYIIATLQIRPLIRVPLDSNAMRSNDRACRLIHGGNTQTGLSPVLVALLARMGW